MSEQIMWAIKGPDGALIPQSIRHGKESAKSAFAGPEWGKCEALGYRCICVKVQEVGDA